MQLSARVYVRPQGLVIIPSVSLNASSALRLPSPIQSPIGSPTRAVPEPSAPALAPNTSLVLCPFGINAKFARWLTPQEDSLKLEAADELRVSLNIWGTAADQVCETQHWAACRLDDNKEAIWPAGLCLIQSEMPDVKPQIPPFIPSPLDSGTHLESLDGPALQAGEYIDALVKVREKERRERMERAMAAAQEQQLQQNTPVSLDRSPHSTTAFPTVNGIKTSPAASANETTYASTPLTIPVLSASSSTAAAPASVTTPMDMDVLNTSTWDAFDGGEGSVWADNPPDADLFEMGALTDADFSGFFDEPGSISALQAPAVPPEVSPFYATGPSPKFSVGGTPFAVHSSPADRFEGSPHTALSPFKTPKTPFSPFVEVEGDENFSSPAQAGSINLGPHLRRSSVSIAQTPASPSKWQISSGYGFEPVTFGLSHVQADERYGAGNKFYLPTPESVADEPDSPSASHHRSNKPRWLRPPLRQRFPPVKVKPQGRRAKSGKRSFGRQRPWTALDEVAELSLADSELSSSASDSDDERPATKSLTRVGQAAATLERSADLAKPIALLRRALATKTEPTKGGEAASPVPLSERAKKLESTMTILAREVIENPTLRRHCGLNRPWPKDPYCRFFFRRFCFLRWRTFL
jgi:hypothetical protein